MPRYEQFNFRKISMAAILKSAQKGGGGPTYKALTSIDQWGPLNKMIPLMEDPGGCTVTPLGPWTTRYVRLEVKSQKAIEITCGHIGRHKTTSIIQNC